MNSSKPSAQNLSTLQVGALIIGLVGAVLAIVGALGDADQFFQSYIFAFLFWVELSLGCLALYMIHSMVNGRWGFSIRRFLAAGSRTLVLMALLFVPLIFGIDAIYAWATEPVTVGGAASYLTTSGFIIRGVAYFVIWIVLAFLLTQWSYKIDNWEQARRVKNLAAGGMILYMLTASMAAVDWNMSLTSDWFSSVFGWLSISRQILMAFALGIVVLAFFWNRKPLKEVANFRAVNDLAVLLLAGVMTWGYLSFMQYFIMWNANLTSKVFWWDKHFAGTWSSYIMIIVALSAVLLVTLLVPGLKKNRSVLIAVAVGVLGVRLMEFFWMVGPSFTSSVSIHWLDVVLPVAMGGLWFAAFAFFLGQQRLVPDEHPELNRVMGAGGHSEDPASTPVVS